MKNGEPIVIDSVRPPHGTFNDGCVALLGLDTITRLGIDINYHADHDQHVALKFRDDKTTTDNVLCKRARTLALQQFPTLTDEQIVRFTGKLLHRKCYLSERICAQYLKEHPDYKVQVVEKHKFKLNGTKIKRTYGGIKLVAKQISQSHK